LAAAIPIMVVQFPLYWMLAVPSLTFSGGIVLAIVQAALATFGIAVFAALASRLYLTLATRLGRPAGLQRA
jgi:hypothetical protein